MRALFTLLAIGFGAMCFANEITTFHDENSGLVMEIPEGFKKTWEVKNHEIGFDVNVFNTNEWDDHFTLIGVIKVPVQCYFDQDIGAVLPIIFKQFEEIFDAEYLEEFGFQIEPIESLAPGKYGAQGFRLNVLGDETAVQLDIHLYFENGHISAILTGGYPVESVDAFSRKILEKVEFTEES